MRFALRSHQPLPAIPAKANDKGVELERDEGMRNNPDTAGGCERNTVRLCLPATVDNFHLASLLNPLLESRQYWICLDASRVSRLGTVEFRVLGSFADQFNRRGGFLRLANVNSKLAALVREFGFTDLMLVVPGQRSAQKASNA